MFQQLGLSPLDPSLTHGLSMLRPALQILENVIRFKWGALPEDQREGIKTFLSNMIIKFSSDEGLFRKESTFVNKLNIILVQILKHDWPAKWKSFIPDIVSASKTSETLCENSMKIFKLLSEEVFDFARLDLTQVCSRAWHTQRPHAFQFFRHPLLEFKPHKQQLHTHACTHLACSLTHAHTHTRALTVTHTQPHTRTRTRRPRPRSSRPH